MGNPNYNGNPSKTQDLADNVTNLFLSGDSIETISEKTDFDKCKVSEILRSSLKNYKSPRKSGQRLTLSDRKVIEFLHNEGKCNYYISKLLGCHCSTISRELKRCGNEDHYSSEDAQKHYDEINHRKRGPMKLKKAASFLSYFCKSFKAEKQSPEACYYKVKAGAVKELSPEDVVSFKTIYNYIHQNLLDVSFSDLPWAPQMKERKRKDFPQENGKHTSGKSIDERPEIPRDEENRVTEFGHWELDCVIGKKGKNEPVILVLLEKKTHFVFLFILNSHTYSEVQKVLELLKENFSDQWDKIFRTITTDNGSEFIPLGRNEKLSEHFYFCHPGRPKEKPQVERMNRNLRIYFPKGESLVEVTDDDLSLVEEWVNNHYRRSLGRNCAQNLFDRELDLIYAA